MQRRTAQPPRGRVAAWGLRGAPRQRQPKVSPRHATKGAGEIPPSERANANANAAKGRAEPRGRGRPRGSQVVFLENARQVIRHMHHTRECDGPCAAAEWNFVGSGTSDKIAADPPRGVASE